MDRRALLRYLLYAGIAVALFMAIALGSAWMSVYIARTARHDLVLRQSRELEHVAMSNQLIQKQLDDLLDEVESSTGARMSVLHNGTNALSTAPILYADNLFAVSKPGWPAGDLQNNVPMSRYARYLPDLLAARCGYYLNAPVDGPDGTRWRQLAVRASVVCPLTGADGRLMGVLFLNWADNVEPPKDTEVPVIMERVQRAAKAISVAFEIRLND